MKAVVCTAIFASATWASEVSPIQKTVQLMSDLQAKVIKEGEVSQKEYEEYSEWCEDRSKELGFEIKTGKSTSEELKASIVKRHRLPKNWKSR